MKSRLFSVAKKSLAILAVLFVFIVPCFTVSAATDDIPHDTFRVQYHQLISGEDVTVDLPGLPSTVQVLNPGIVNLSVDNYIIFYVDNGVSQPYYQAYLFTEGIDPLEVNIQLGFNVDADEMTATYKALIEEEYGAVKADMYERIVEGTISRFDSDFLNFFYGLYLDFIADYSAYGLEAIEKEAMLTHSSFYYQNILLERLNDNSDFFKQQFDNFGWRPFTTFNINYSRPMEHWVLLETYRYTPGISGSWQFLNSINLSQSRPYGYGASVVGQPVCSSFKRGNILNSGVVPSSYGLSETAIVNDYKEQIRSEIKVNSTPESVPSWHPNQSGGSGSGSTTGGFHSGSWYNDGGTGNPFVAVLLAPWIGLQWTWSNVASRINLFGVSIADILLTFTGVIVIWAIFKLVSKIVRG